MRCRRSPNRPVEWSPGRAVALEGEPILSETFTISELAREFAITPRAIRHYEDEGLLDPARNGQNRVYSVGDRVRLGFILRGKRVGFSLAEVKEMLDLYKLGDNQLGQLRLTLRKCQERIDLMERRRRDIDATIKELVEYSRVVEGLLQQRHAAGVSPR